MSDLQRDIYEVANQLGGYVGPGTEERLAKFLIRESNEAAKLAAEIERLQRALDTANGLWTFWNEKAQEMAGKLADARRQALIEAAEIVATATLPEPAGVAETLVVQGARTFAGNASAPLRAKAEETQG